jgi:type VI secretion system secreted protein VgrG
MGKYTQERRLLGIATPLGEDYFLLQHFESREAISELYEIKVQMFHEEDRERFKHTAVDPKDILGKPATVRIDQYTDEYDSRFYTGIINTFSQGTRNDAFSIYYATIVPHVWMLTQKYQSRIFQHMTIPDILRKVLADFNFSIEVTRSHKPRNYVVQYRESDWDFVSRLMEEEGIYYYFTHDGQMEKLIISDSPQSHIDCPNNAEFPFHYEELDEDVLVTSIKTWHTDIQLTTGKVTLWDHNFQLPKQKLDIEQPSRFTVGENQKMEMYDFPGGYASNYDGIDKSGGNNAGELQNIYPDKDQAAKDLMEAIDAQFEVSFGTSLCSPMTAGHKFKLKGHPTAALNRQYLITEIEHEADQHPDYFEDSHLEVAYRNKFKCIPIGGTFPAFRPGRRTEKPKIYGTQTATVVGPSGEEIFTDEYGRVKVQFHWDREGKADADSSCWVRVSQGWAGNKWGIMFIPRIGMEVVVHFIEGDPDRPIITGCVYNPDAMPPYKLPEHKTKSTIKSDTHKGSGFNEVRFEDEKDKEQIFIHAQKDKDIRVLNDCKELIKNDRHLIVENEQFEEIKKDKHLTIKGDHKEKIGGTMSIDVGSDIHEKVAQNYAHESGQSVHIKAGMSAVIEAGATLTLKVGGNFININSGGIFIKGTMVMINSGGAAGSGAGARPDAPTAPKEADNAEPGTAPEPPKPPKPLKPTQFSPMAVSLKRAAADGTPFCAICEQIRKEREQQGTR